MKKILYGDNIEVLRRLPDFSVECCVTSPPYVGQRAYGGDEREFGQDKYIAGYALSFIPLFEELERVVCGPVFLNIGDKANYSGGAGGDWKGKSGGPKPFHDKTYARQSFLDVPGEVLRVLLRLGWRLRGDIIWNKVNPKPEQLSHVKRPLLQHERIFMLSKSGKYKFYPERMVEKGNVWTFPPGGSGPKHLAPFPDELVRRCILPTTDEGDTVLDPFSGSGTTVRVADELGRNGLGIELYQK